MVTAYSILGFIFLGVMAGAFFLARRKFIPLPILKLGTWVAVFLVVALELWILVLLLTF